MKSLNKNKYTLACVICLLIAITTVPLKWTNRSLN